MISPDHISAKKHIVGVSLSEKPILAVILLTIVYCIVRRDSIFSAFGMGPAASGRRVCDIDRVLFRGTKSLVRELGILSRRKFTNNLGFSILIIIGILFSCKDLPIFSPVI